VVVLASGKNVKESGTAKLEMLKNREETGQAAASESDWFWTVDNADFSNFSSTGTELRRLLVAQKSSTAAHDDYVKNLSAEATGRIPALYT